MKAKEIHVYNSIVQEIWTNAHETRDSISLSWIISAQFTVKMCTATWNREKFTKNPYFGGSRSFKVIDVGTTRKLVSSACYDKQQVGVYLQPFSR